MRSWVAVIAVAVCALSLPPVADAQIIPPSERDALVRMRVDRGGRAEEIDALLRVAGEAGAKGLPVTPLVSKIREGVAKGADPMRIDAVIRQMTTHLEAADRLIRDLQPGATAGDRAASVTLLADAFGSGVTTGDVREIRKLAEATGKPPISSDAAAGAAKGLSFVKDVQLPVTERTAVMAEAVRQGYHSHEMLDLGREIKRRERDYKEGRASLMALRDAIARGSRPDQLFRDTRAGAPARPAATRPEPVSRPERPVPPERPLPPERPVRPERPTTERAR